MFAKTTQQRGESPKKHKAGAGNSSKPGGDADSSMNAGDIGSPSRASLLSGQGGTGSPKNPGGTDAGAPVEHISKHQMKSLLQSEYTDEKLSKGFDDCCSSIKPCSEKIAQIAVGIEELYSLNPNQIVGNVVEMEESIQKKCAELKKQKGMVEFGNRKNILSCTSSIFKRISPVTAWPARPRDLMYASEHIWRAGAGPG